MKFNPVFIDDFSRQASRYLRAIRSIQTLETFLPDSFPEPNKIEIAKRPYDLEFIWLDSNLHTMKDKLSKYLNVDKWNRWKNAYNGNTIIKVLGKDVLNLLLTIETL
jgi:hypothetical protein